MELLLDIGTRNAVLRAMAQLLDHGREGLLAANKKDLAGYKGTDIAMRDRLKVDDEKIAAMILSLQQLAAQEDPLGVERFKCTHENGMQISNITAPFGTVMIIYESRPDVTIEAAGIAFKSGNKILLKGGKESLRSNLVLVSLWHQALKNNEISPDWIQYLQFNRSETQAFLERPSQKLDLIVPRGGEALINFVKKHARCPVIVSGRGNNFLFVDKDADIPMAISLILNGKTTKISACNALDKVLVHADLPNRPSFLKELIAQLKQHKVQVYADTSCSSYGDTTPIVDTEIWYKEFLDHKIVIGEVSSVGEALYMINTYSGGHSSVIVTRDNATADIFMGGADTAAVYHNASTRFTDGGQFGLGGELAISTDKLHQRGPIGLQHLVTNKWLVKGNGQIR
jgi:glutamate-5-semialdehyde dehydrogenase